MKKLLIMVMLSLFVASITTSCTPQNIVNDEEYLTDPDESTNPQTPPEDDPDNGEG